MVYFPLHDEHQPACHFHVAINIAVVIEMNDLQVKRKRFETSFGRASKLQRFPRFVAEGNRDIIIKKTSAKQEVALVRETLWSHYSMVLSSYSYYASLDGVFGEPDSSAYQLGRYYSI